MCLFLWVVLNNIYISLIIYYPHLAAVIIAMVIIIVLDTFFCYYTAQTHVHVLALVTPLRCENPQVHEHTLYM